MVRVHAGHQNCRPRAREGMEADFHMMNESGQGRGDT